MGHLLLRQPIHHTYNCIKDRLSATALSGLLAIFITPLMAPTAQAETWPLGATEDYIADPRTMDEVSELTNKSMQKRREFGWNVLRKSLRPINVQNPKRQLPLWITWYDRDEVRKILSDGVKKYGSQANKHGLPTELANKAIAEHAVTREGINIDTYSDMIREFGVKGVPSFSPAFIRHMLENYKDIVACDFATSPREDLMEATSFSACMKEFPKEAVMVKTAWKLVETPEKRCRMEYFDYSGDSWVNAYAGVKRRDLAEPTPQYKFLKPKHVIPVQPAINDGECGESTLSQEGQVRGEYKPVPGPDKIYTMTTRANKQVPEQTWALAALHIVTKETREWVWASWHWAPDDKKDLDLGMDRPADLPKPWNNYKLTIATGFEEEDPKPWYGANGEFIATLKDVYDVRKQWSDRSEFLSFTQWSSNPYLEVADPDSNCVGCHQTPVGLVKSIYGSMRRRLNFPADFSFQIIGFDGNANFQEYLAKAMKPDSNTRQIVQTAQHKMLEEMLDKNCMRCHGDGSHGAPKYSKQRFVYGTDAIAAHFRNRGAELVSQGIMPKDTPLPPEQRQQFSELIQCISNNECQNKTDK